jgi:hypothetical protein
MERGENVKSVSGSINIKAHETRHSQRTQSSNILWYIHPMLGNDDVTYNYTQAVTK